MTMTNEFVEDDAVVGFEDEKATPEVTPKVTNVTETQIVSKNKGMKVCAVGNCQKLNVRKGPGLEFDVITIIEKDKLVLVDRDVPEENGFVKVSLSSGIEGYCMSKFIVNSGE